MSQQSSGNPPPDDSGTPIDWSEIIDDWVKYGRDVLDRVSNRATTNAATLEGKTYGRDHLLDDLGWFWQEAAKDAADAIKYVRDKFPTT